jgi:hypothetical protein
MRIPLPGGGFIEPDEGRTPYHKRIAHVERLENTRSGHRLRLECGHECLAFGDLTVTGGMVLCEPCRDADLAVRYARHGRN